MRTAACVAVGSELLGDHLLDSNSLKITEALAQKGVPVVEKRVVGDDAARVARVIGALARDVDLVVVTGGLGPTADDVTREAVAAAVGKDLVHDPQSESWIRDRYKAARREMPEICLDMARVIPGARVLRNTRGSAPGLMLEHDGCLLAVFPGVPCEMEEMLERDLLPVVAAWAPGQCRRSRTLLLGGVIESETEERIQHLYDRFGRESVTILAFYGVLNLVLSAEGDEEISEQRLDEMEAAFREVLGDDVAATGAEGLAEVVLDLLGKAGSTLATAESCTGGTIGAWITEVPGSSESYLGGIVSYSNQAKEDLLGVPEQLLIEHGAVSQPVAEAMAEGARRALHATWGLGITGVAGPGGGTEEKPVGLVHWAVAGPDEISSEHRVFPGSRSIVRQWSANSLLDHLRRRLERHTVGS